MNTTFRAALKATHALVISSWLLLCMSSIRGIVESDPFGKTCAVGVAVVSGMGMVASIIYLLWWYTVTAEEKKGEQNEDE